MNGFHIERSQVNISLFKVPLMNIYNKVLYNILLSNIIWISFGFYLVRHHSTLGDLVELHHSGEHLLLVASHLGLLLLEKIFQTFFKYLSYVYRISGSLSSHILEIVHQDGHLVSFSLRLSPAMRKSSISVSQPAASQKVFIYVQHSFCHSWWPQAMSTQVWRECHHHLSLHWLHWQPRLIS